MAKSTALIPAMARPKRSSLPSSPENSSETSATPSTAAASEPRIAPDGLVRVVSAVQATTIAGAVYWITIATATLRRWIET